MTFIWRTKEIDLWVRGTIILQCIHLKSWDWDQQNHSNYISISKLISHRKKKKNFEFLHFVSESTNSNFFFFHGSNNRTFRSQHSRDDAFILKDISFIVKLRLQPCYLHLGQFKLKLGGIERNRSRLIIAGLVHVKTENETNRLMLIISSIYHLKAEIETFLLEGKNMLSTAYICGVFAFFVCFYMLNFFGRWFHFHRNS